MCAMTCPCVGIHPCIQESGTKTTSHCLNSVRSGYDTREGLPALIMPMPSLYPQECDTALALWCKEGCQIGIDLQSSPSIFTSFLYSKRLHFRNLLFPYGAGAYASPLFLLKVTIICLVEVSRGFINSSTVWNQNLPLHWRESLATRALSRWVYYDNDQLLKSCHGLLLPYETSFEAHEGRLCNVFRPRAYCILQRNWSANNEQTPWFLKETGKTTKKKNRPPEKKQGRG